MGKIDAKTAVCGLIGNPVGHSISPFIHNTLAERLGFNLAYMTFKVEKGEVATAVKGAYALNIRGMNVTVPHKQEVMEAVIEIDELAVSFYICFLHLLRITIWVIHVYWYMLYGHLIV